MAKKSAAVKKNVLPTLTDIAEQYFEAEGMKKQYEEVAKQKKEELLARLGVTTGVIGPEVYDVFVAKSLNVDSVARVSFYASHNTQADFPKLKTLLTAEQYREVVKTIYFTAAKVARLP